MVRVEANYLVILIAGDRSQFQVNFPRRPSGEAFGNGRVVIQWEKGRRAPRVYRLPAIIRFLGYNPLPEPRTISERLLAKRLEQGWSRKLAARHLGIDVSTLRDWEQVKVILFRKHRSLVANVLGIPESELGDEMKTRWRAAHSQTGAA